MGTSSWDRSRPRATQRKRRRQSASANDQTCLLEQPSQGAGSPEKQCSSWPSHIFAFATLPARMPLVPSHLAKHCHSDRQSRPHLGPGCLLSTSPGVPPGSPQNQLGPTLRLMGWGLGDVMSFLSPVPASPPPPPCKVSI